MMSFVLRVVALVLSVLSLLSLLIKDLKVQNVMMFVSAAVVCLAVDSVVSFRGKKK
jgi:hypothetical protein